MPKEITTIEIDADHRIEIDEMNYSLVRRSVSEKGNESWNRLGYYGSPDACLWALVERDIATSGKHHTSIGEFLAAFKEAAAEYRKPYVVARVGRALDKLKRAREEKKEAERAAKEAAKKATAKKPETETPKPKPKRSPAKPVKKARKPVRKSR
jgi:hypothetical protein